MMEAFSLEDNDYGDLFITQTPRNIEENIKIDGKEYGDKGFIEPNLSYLKSDEPHYSDISEDDFVDIPCSHKPKNVETNEER